jgi:hypothetical protein
LTYRQLSLDDEQRAYTGPGNGRLDAVRIKKPLRYE